MYRYWTMRNVIPTIEMLTVEIITVKPKIYNSHLPEFCYFR